MRPRSKLTCLLLLLAPCLCQGSLPGLPFLRNYDKYTYQGGTQNWEIAQTAEGVLLVANNEGLLTFDGVSWDKYPLPNRSIVRSLKADASGRVYVGGQDELGYFEPDAAGLLRYHSLMHLLPQELLPIADVWDILITSDRVLFRTSQHLFSYRQGSMELLVTDRLEVLGGGHGRVLFQSATMGLVEWTPAGISVYPGGEQFRDVLITDIRPGPQGAVLLCTLREGLFLAAEGQIRPWALEAAPQIRALRPQATCTLSGGQVAVATELGGLLLLDAGGRLQLTFDRGRGLQNNYITTLFEDQGGNLWMGLNNGLSMAEIAAPYRYLVPDGPLLGTAYAALHAGGSLYLGTPNGLYEAPAGASARLIPGTESQVWGLHQVGGQVLLAHHEGSFSIAAGAARPSGPGAVQGVWLHLPLRSRPGYVIAGHYSGLALYRQSPAGLEFVRRLAGFTESCRFLVEDREGLLWASHPYRGIFRIRLSDSLDRVAVKRYGPEHGLPSTLYNHVFFIQGEVIVAGERGLFRLNPVSDRYDPHPDYAAIFAPEERIIRLTEDARGHIWFATDRRAGVIRIEDQGLQRHSELQYYPRLSGKLVNGFELICPVSDSLVIAGMDRGFFLFDPRQAPAHPRPWQALISKVFCGGSRDSLLAGPWQRSTIRRVPNWLKDFRFRFGVTDFSGPDGIWFRYRLKGLEAGWSEWQPAAGKEYTNLPPGSYTFELQARNPDGMESEIAAFRFEITPPWYASLGARIVYLLLLILAAGGLILIPRRRFEKEKAEIVTLHQTQKAAQLQELARSQETIGHLMREKLESEISHKTRELATATMHLVQKNEVLAHLREELEQVASRNPGHPGSAQLREIIRMLNHDQQFDADWEQFASHFDQVHEGFLRRLQERYPQLTPKDQRLCAYLRMNLATKEIAPLMNISVRGVEISRYRLRKKLGLDSEVNLNEFMMGF